MAEARAVHLIDVALALSDRTWALVIAWPGSGGRNDQGKASAIAIGIETADPGDPRAHVVMVVDWPEANERLH